MTQTIIATFDSPTDADQVVIELTAAGIVAAAIQVHSQDTGTTPPEADSAHVSGDHDHARHGFFDRIERFFSDLVGEKERPAEFHHYHEAIRRGGALVSVDTASDSEFQQVQRVMEEAGAVDIDERASQWQSSGYTPAPSATPARTLGTTGAMSSTAGLTDDEPDTTPQREAVIAKELAMDDASTQTYRPYRVYPRTSSADPLARDATGGDLDAPHRPLP